MTNTKYRKLPHHSKKIQSLKDQDRMARRKRLSNFHRKTWRNKTKGICVREGYKRDRMSIKNRIFNGDWDNFIHNKRREFVNPWDWD